MEKWGYVSLLILAMCKIHNVQFCIENYQEICIEFYGKRFIY